MRYKVLRWRWLTDGGSIFFPKKPISRYQINKAADEICHNYKKNIMSFPDPYFKKIENNGGAQKKRYQSKCG